MKKYFKIIALTAILLISFNSFSQNPYIKLFSDGDLIFSNHLDIDSRNNKYVATDFSIVKFDNFNWTKIIDGNFKSLLVYDDNTLYAVDNQGFLNIIDLPSLNVEKSPLFENYLFLNDYNITMKKDSQGRVWIAGNDYAGKQGKNILTHGSLSVMYNPVNRTTYNLSSALNSNYSQVETMNIDNLDNKWMITYAYNSIFTPDTIKVEGNIYLLKSDADFIFSSTWRGYRTDFIIDYNSIDFDSENNLWLGNDFSGIYNFNGFDWINYNASNSDIPNNFVNDIAIDEMDNKWVLNANSIISKFSNEGWTSYDSSFTKMFIEYDKILNIDKYGNKWILSKFNGIVVFNENGINLGDNMISGQLSYDADPDIFPLRDVQIYLKHENIIIDSTLTDSLGMYQFSNLPDGHYEIDYVLNMEWGGSDPLDALIIMKYYLKDHNFAFPLTLLAANVNDDRGINPTDALLINRRFIGLINSFKIPDFLDTNESPIIVDGQDVIHNIMVVAAGDINGTNVAK